MKMVKKTIFITIILFSTNLPTIKTPELILKTLVSLNNNLNPGFKGKVKAEMSILAAALLGIKAGISDGIQATTSEAISYPLSALHDLIVFTNSLFWQVTYRLSFGANKLNCRNLMLINNHIYTLCTPFIQVKQANIRTDVYDQNWEIIKESLISELRHAYFYVKKALPCYSPLYLQKDYKRNVLTSLFYSFCENNEQVTFYMIRTIFYIDNLIKHIESLKTYQDSVDNIKETRRWLSWVCESFEQTSKFLTIKQDHTKYKFYKLDNNSSSNLSGIDNYLPGPNN